MNLNRQSFLGANSTAVIRAARVAVIGLCGGGSHVAQQLAHIGVGNFKLIDDDNADDTNLNRMVGLTALDVLKQAHKTDVIERLVKAVNPDANVKLFPTKWQQCATELRDCSAIFGCVDSFAQREQIERFARRFMIPYIDIGMDVFGESGAHFISGQSILSLPGHACMRCMGFLTEALLDQEAKKYGATGGKPQVVWPNGSLASAAVGQFMSLLTPWNRQTVAPLYLEYDGNRCTVQPSKRLTCIHSNICTHFDGENALGDVFV
ncbi:MAG: ThiF family adenylyltransferase [Casimicrobium sp.]